MADPRTLDAFGRLVDLMHRLRAPGGCPWDAEQSHASLRPYLLEEAYEVLDALAGENDAEICEELGDLLLQVVFHAELAAETGRFDAADVANGICDKLVRRHPHVFGDTAVQDSAEVLRNWQQIKAVERGDAGAPALARVDAVSRSLPALVRAEEIGRKAAVVGFDWPDAAGVKGKVLEELAEVEQALASSDPAAVHREVGDLLLAMASWARHLGVAPELALRDATERFVGRLHQCDDLAASRGRSLGDLNDQERNQLWEAAKAAAAPSRPGPH
jgi:MazG family protein